MEDITLRFSHLSEKIFKSLDNKNLVKCMEVSRMWCSHLKVQKFVQIRTVKAIVRQFDDVEETWNDVFMNNSTEIIIELQLAVQEFYKEFEHNPELLNSSHGLSPIHIAAGVSNINLMKWLQEKTTDKYPKNQDGWTPLHAAAESGNLKTFKMIFDEVEEKNPSAGFGVVGNNWTPLHSIAVRGHLKMFKYVTNRIEDINPSSGNGYTPLYAAVYMGNYEICRLMMDRLEDKNPGGIVDCVIPQGLLN